MNKKLQYYLLFLLFSLISQNNAFSSGFVYKILLNPVLQTFNRPMLSPKNVGNFVHWLTLLYPIPGFFLWERKKKEKILSLEQHSIPHNQTIDALIEDTLSIDPQRIIVLPDDVLSGTEFTYNGKIYVSEGLYNFLQDADEIDRFEAFGAIGHEIGHTKHSDFVTQYTGLKRFISTHMKNILSWHICGKLYKSARGVSTISKNSGYIMSSIKGFFTGYLKNKLTMFISLKNNRSREYQADRIILQDPEKNYKVLDGFARILSDFQDDYYHLRHIKKYPEETIWINEFFMRHPDTKKRIEKIEQQKQLLLEQNPDLRKKIEDGTLWKD